MKLPEKIKGRNRIRDAAIVVEFKRTRPLYSVLAKKFNLTEMRISQILRANHAFIPIDKTWEKEKRITRLERWLEDPKNKDTRKDPLEVQEALKHEIEGEQINGSRETKVVIIRDTHGNKDQGRSISGQVSILTV